ncbi:hypothetical protein MAR_008826 [Mya arenaria]|uniref:Uncharacterized protein n=1 Tax=Mya arenaria TaxID=6604 RepID=A0ABY7DX04_MYAAR|nr:hypothetical protein MAR_008826 [Mya arenaria]
MQRIKSNITQNRLCTNGMCNKLLVTWILQYGSVNYNSELTSTKPYDAGKPAILHAKDHCIPYVIRIEKKTHAIPSMVKTVCKY